jgi:hypothetical protein
MKTYSQRLLVLSIVITISCGTICASEVADQAHVLASITSSAGVGGLSERNVAQTFRVGISGQLTKLEFWAYRTIANVGDLTFDLRPVTPDGKPVEDDDLAFAELVIPRNEIMGLGSASTPPIEPLLVSLDLTPFGLFFQSGDLVAFNFRSIATDSIRFGILGNYGPKGGQGPYANGQAFMRTDSVFYPWEGTGPEIGPIDLGFKTFVRAVPEPSAICLFWIAAAIANVACRQRLR